MSACSARSGEWATCWGYGTTRSLRTTILLGFIVITTAVTGVFAVSVYVRSHRAAHDSLEEKLELRAKALAGALTLDHDGLDWDYTLELEFREYAEEGSGAYFFVFYPNGDVFRRSPSIGKQLLPSPPEWRADGVDCIEIEEGPDGLPCAVLTLSFHVRIDRTDDDDEEDPEATEWVPPPEERLRFQVQVAADTRERDDGLSGLALFLGLAGGAALLVSVVCGTLLSRRVLRPLRRMTEEAERLVPHDTDRRLGPDTVVKELHSLAVSFNKALDRQSEALELQRRFTSDASHELRTPVSILLANSELLLRRPRSPEEYREGLERQQRTARRMSGITESLLTLARVDTAGNGIEMRPVELGTFLGSICEEFRVLARESEIRLGCEVEPGTTVLGNAEYLTQLVTNLISNALKFTPPGGEVEVTAAVEGERVVITCSDTGPGIPPEHQTRIFGRFYRVNEGKDRREGAGLGLAIVSWVARIHGGEVAVESRPGEGTTFRVGIPGRRDNPLQTRR